jgi:hypothetical protein
MIRSWSAAGSKSTPKKVPCRARLSWGTFVAFAFAFAFVVLTVWTPSALPTP